MNCAPNVVPLLTVNFTKGDTNVSLGTYNDTGVGMGLEMFTLTNTEELEPGR